MSDLPLFLQQSDLLVLATCLASIAFGAALRGRLCFSFSADGGPDPEARCPPSARADEVRFSPGGEKLSVRYEEAPDLAAIAAPLTEWIDTRFFSASASKSRKVSRTRALRRKDAVV